MPGGEPSSWGESLPGGANASAGRPRGHWQGPRKGSHAQRNGSSHPHPRSGHQRHRPNIVHLMTDDQGWGEVGYRGHSIIKSPNLDAMAANGLRLDRFYAGAPVCSPTRASVLTGRSPDRTGVPTVYWPLRLQERTLPGALRAHGYATGHFGKWHLDGMQNAHGGPIYGNASHGPGAFGFEHWLSNTACFDTDPLLGRHDGTVNGSLSGDSSDLLVAEALRFIAGHAAAGRPSFAAVWYSAPHDTTVQDSLELLG